MKTDRYTNINTIARIKEVALIVSSYCCNGVLSKSLKDIYSDQIKGKFFISERTFKRYINYSREYLGYEFKTK